LRPDIAEEKALSHLCVGVGGEREGKGEMRFCLFPLSVEEEERINMGSCAACNADAGGREVLLISWRGGGEKGKKKEAICH